MTYKQGRLAICAIVLAVIATLGSPYALSKGPGTELIRIGYLPIASDSSFFVAVENGLFKAVGLEVEAIKFETSNQALEALVTGRINATAVVALEAALALEANTPGQFRIIEMTAATADSKVHRIIVKTDSVINTLASLCGKRVGTFPGTQMVVFLKLILQKFCDAQLETSIIQLKPPLQPQALEQGQVDALFCLEPTGTLLESRGIARAISVNPLYEFIQQPFPTGVSLVSASLATQRPKIVSKLMKALAAAHDLTKKRPAEAASALPKYVPIEPEIAPKVAMYDYWDVPSIDKEAVQQLADLYRDTGVLTKKVSTAGLYAKPLEQPRSIKR